MLQTNILQHFRAKKTGNSAQLSSNTKHPKILGDTNKFDFEIKPEIKIDTKISNDTPSLTETHAEDPIKVDIKNNRKRSRGILFSA